MADSRDTRPLEDRIVEELHKTGYPTEILSASIMQQKGWFVAHNPSYLDDVENRNREFDIRAFKSWTVQAPGQQYVLGVYLVTECKKSEKPWVFFTTPSEHEYDETVPYAIMKRGGPSDMFRKEHPNRQAIVPFDELRTFHHYCEQQRWARTYYEPFKGQDKADRAQMIYSAVTSATKAVLYLRKVLDTPGFTGIYYPLIIFGGDMFEAQVTQYKDVTVSRCEYIQVLHNYIDPKGSRSSIWDNTYEFIVDVVHENYLPAFLSKIEAEHNHIATIFEQALGTRRLMGTSV